MKADWSKLEGKKILVIGCSERTPVMTGVIVGCDPDIGICIADLDNIKPWFVVHGPESPSCKHKPQEWKETRRLDLEGIYRQLQSGYFSRFEDEINDRRIYGKITMPSFSTPSCPFSS